jgi:hypothetical protein
MHEVHAGSYEGEVCTDMQQACMGCYCDALLFTSPLAELTYCSGQAVRVLRVYGVNVCLTAITAALNAFLEAYTTWATARELHAGRTASQASKLQAQFIAQLLNTVVVGVRLFLLLRRCLQHAAPFNAAACSACAALLLHGLLCRPCTAGQAIVTLSL